MAHLVVGTLAQNRVLGPHTFVLRLTGCEALAGCLPGQFVMLRGDWGTDPLLPRAFSLLAVDGGAGTADILVKTAGKATARLEVALPGATFQLLGPLGTSFRPPSIDRPEWLVAGGVGLAPLLMHAARAAEVGAAAALTMFYGGRTAADLVLLDDIAATGCEIVLATEDGSRGRRGYVTDAVNEALTALRDGAPAQPATLPTLLACGPEGMLAAAARIAHAHDAPAYLSLEGEMACGIGACLACAVPCTSAPYRYTCVHGPVFDLSELAGPYARVGGANAGTSAPAGGRDD
jgi:dihydroorotate dehydrogenase electron transfer subunit